MDITAGHPDSPARDYARIARAIGFLRDNAATQPDLAAAARHAGLSEHHFQRLFTRWAGISPKRFLQFLTVEDARRRLAATRNTLDLAAEIGLSGGGRLHDLFVTLEAVSPGEALSGGAGIDIRWGLHDTPFGSALLALTTRGICALHFVDSADQALDCLRETWPRAVLKRDQQSTADTAQRVFAPLQEPRRPLSLLVKGSNFQVQVWRALLALPPGALTTYGELASAIGRPEAARAVGTAVGANTIAYLIPCHRVIRASGMISGYRWGSTRKAAMLGREAGADGKPAGLFGAP
ncbi:MAG: methylated-DNA--[protein]-cysteine S-methyltransferase [Burkholderiales bacterium]|nr:methylated-DNA--[protein]-cysteine S-methyltransferase [Burkholderiales bacterium]